MKNKTTGIFVITLLMTNLLVGVVLANEKDINIKLPSKSFGYIKSNENETEVETFGPILPLLGIAKINLFDGDFPPIILIKLILRSRILHWTFPYPTFPVINFDFSVTYGKEIPSSPFYQRFSYGTLIIEDGNESYITKPHTITVEGFTGYFILVRKRPFQLYPAMFGFVGNCKKVMVSDL